MSLMSTFFPKHNSFLISPTRLFSTMLLRASQTSCKVLGHRSTWLPKDVCVPHCLKSRKGSLISLLRQDCSQAFVQHPSRPSMPSSPRSLQYSWTLNSPLLLSHFPWLSGAMCLFGSSSCLYDTSHRAALSFIRGCAQDYLSN